MKRLKKAALAVACAAVLCSVFSGCGGDKKDTAKAAPAEEKVLTVYTARSESLNNLVIPAFEKETGIKVNVIVAGTGPLVKRVIHFIHILVLIYYSCPRYLHDVRYYP